MTALQDQHELVNITRKLPHRSIFVERALNEPGFAMATIYGRRQVGKSMLGLKYLLDCYGNWEEVFSHLFYSRKEFILYLNKVRKIGKKIPMVMLDDAGIFFGSNQYNLDRRGAILFSNSFDTIATIIKSCIFTLPNNDNLLKSIRVAENISSIKVTLGKGKFDRTATCYMEHRTPWGQTPTSKNWIEHFDVRIEEKYYERYFKIRDSYSADTLQRMMDYLNSDSTGVFENNGRRYSAQEIDDEQEED